MKKLWMVAAATSIALLVNAQDTSVETQGIGVVIDAHALVDVVNDEIVFDFSDDDPLEAGEPFTLGVNKDQTTDLNYSFMLSNGGVPDATISVRATNIKPGMALTLLADGTAASSLDPSTYGLLGNVAPNFDINQGGSPVLLTSVDQTLIENIGTSYTGNGPSNGYQLFYTMRLNDYSQLVADNGAQNMGTVTYTIAE